MSAQLFDPGRLTRDELRKLGRSRRASVPRSDHSRWAAAARRPDPLDILRAQDSIRVPELVPIRYGRMLESPFRFFRGSAAVMAHDLSTTPSTQIHVQSCGDAHVGNFGIYASPERHLVFDVNDFDETLPGPWEWDLKRLVASLTLEARDQGWKRSVATEAVVLAVSRYQAVLRRLMDESTLAIGYGHMDEAVFLERYGSKRSRKDLIKVLAKSRQRTHDQAVRKWVERVDGAPRFIDDPPVLERLTGEQADTFHRLLNRYRETLRHDRRHVMAQYRFRDAAHKIVGVGSVGLRSYVILLEGRAPDDLVVLQAKQATSSVLSPFLGPSGFARHGQRVVIGQRLMQAISDPFLGWAPHGAGDYYVRQLRDHKGPSDLADDTRSFHRDGQVVGGTLARAHARSVDPAVLSGYIGTSERIGHVLAEFADSYADQVEQDFEHVVGEARRKGLAIERGI